MNLLAKDAEDDFCIRFFKPARLWQVPPESLLRKFYMNLHID